IVPSDARRDFEKWGSWLQRGSTVSYTNANSAVETMAEAIQRFKTEYLPARRNFIYNTQVVGKGGQIPQPQTGGATFNYTPLLVTGAPAKALVPTNGNLSVTWIGIPSFEPFNATGWISGATGVGYERGTGYEGLIGLNVNTEMRSNNSVYIRLEFNVTNPAAFDRLELRMKSDDGFVAFLNGTVLASANAPSSPQWNSAATAQHEANPATFDIYDVTAKKANLRAGRNVLAIQGLNDSVGSSDMIIVPELYGGTLGPPNAAQPVINFGGIEFNPASGNQDAEFIQLLNPNSIAVDISDWRLTGGIEHTFAPGTVLAPNGALYVCPNAAAFRARTVSPKGGEGLFVQGGYHGHLSSLGETLTLLDASGATNNTTTYQGQPSDAQRYLVVSELMYHPSGDGLAEFIELLNLSGSVTLDLMDVRFTQGVEFNFTGSAITSLPPGARVLVVRDLAAFTAVHGAGRPVAGVFTNGTALSNGGERIKLEDADNGTVREFAYDDDPPWPAGTDGTGYSLVLIAPHTNPDHGLATSWRSSARPGGSPGATDAVPFPADPMADANGNGERDLIDYALGNDLGLPPILPAFTLQPDALGGPATLLLTYAVSLGAERAAIEVLFSTDLLAWTAGAPHLEAVSIAQLGDGRALITWRVKSPLRDEPQVFMRLRAVGQ
ncbi:MAG: lamin tail domain-containing protein, partial [Verrucomicrobiota bacterium]